MERIKKICTTNDIKLDVVPQKVYKPTPSEINPNWRHQPNFNTRKVVRPSKEELQKLVEEISLEKLGEKFGVTGNAIKKWCEIYGIQSKPRGYWNKVYSNQSKFEMSVV